MSDQNLGQSPQDPNQPQQPPQPYGQAYGNAPAPVPPTGVYGYQPGYGGGPAQAVPDTSTNAIVAFVLAICSWVFCPIILAIVALVFVSKAKKEILASNGWRTGTGFVTAAKWVAWINIIFGILMIVFYIVVFVIIAASGGFNPNDNYDFQTPGVLLLSFLR